MALAEGMSQIPFDRRYLVCVMTTRTQLQRPRSHVAKWLLSTSDPVWTQRLQVLCPVTAYDGGDIRSFVPICNNHSPQLTTILLNGLAAGPESPNSGSGLRISSAICGDARKPTTQPDSPTIANVLMVQTALLAIRPRQASGVGSRSWLHNKRFEIPGACLTLVCQPCRAM